MRLTGQQFQEILDAIAGSFDRGDLQRMLRVRLDRRLDQFAGDGDLESVILEVIAAAEREGWLPDLIREAAGWHPGNTALAILQRTLPPEERPVESKFRTRPAEWTFPRIDPENPPYALLRRLLTSAYDAPGLRRFCQVREPFRQLLTRFAPDHGLSDMADRVLEHARIYILWDELLSGLAEENPYQFELFLEQLQRLGPDGGGR